MTQEEKELLMKDLCSRLLYGVKVSFRCNHIHVLKSVLGSGLTLITETVTNVNTTTDVENIKPYLFPLSSMTEEQEKKFTSLYYRYYESAFSFNERFSYDRYSIKDIGFYPYYLQDWLDSNHFDYRGLIEKGLAIDCTNLNIY